MAESTIFMTDVHVFCSVISVYVYVYGSVSRSVVTTGRSTGYVQLLCMCKIQLARFHCAQLFAAYRVVLERL